MRRLAGSALSLAAAALPLWSGAAQAHGSGHAGVMTGWSLEPLALGLLTVSAALYSAGLLRMDSALRRAIAPSWRIGSYLTAVVIIVAGLFSPIDAAADRSFAWHMAQHLLLMLGAGPLLALANTHLVALMAFPLGTRRRIGRSVNRAPGVRQGASHRSAPLLAALAFVLGLWLWHAPRLYDAALAYPALHTLEHLTFVLTSALFWRMVSTSGDRRLDALSAIALVTVVGLQGNLLAALITLSPQPLYAHYRTSGLADQQIAGLLMWLPAGLIYVASSAMALKRLLWHPMTH
jgi:cytochrome c oxidase assembly factor CtaG